MPRPRSLTRSRIASAALSVLDRDGLAALSMRAVATELRVGTMSLYRYVEDREALERLIVDHVLDAVDVTTPARASWTRRIVTLADRVRAAVSVHPAIAPLLMVHRHSSSGVMRCAEAVLGALVDAGFSGRRRVVALRTLISYVIGALQAQHLGPLSGPGTAALASLPDGVYPLLADTARHARHVSEDEEFRRGLEIVLRGLARPASRARSRRGHASR